MYQDRFYLHTSPLLRWVRFQRKTWVSFNYKSIDIEAIERLASGIHGILGKFEQAGVEVGREEYEVLRSALADIMMYTLDVRETIMECEAEAAAAG